MCLNCHDDYDDEDIVLPQEEGSTILQKQSALRYYSSGIVDSFQATLVFADSAFIGTEVLCQN
jgi:hypothetical protein